MISMMKRFIPRRYLPTAHKLHGQLGVFPYYLGHRVYCSWCDHHFRRFVPFGRADVPGLHGPTQNGMCPRCHCIDRHRLLWLYPINFHQMNLSGGQPECLLLKRRHLAGSQLR